MRRLPVNRSSADPCSPSLLHHLHERFIQHSTFMYALGASIAPLRGDLMRIRLTLAATATAVAATLAVVIAAPAQAAEYSSALKIKGAQYDAPGRDSNSFSTGNTKSEYLTIKNYSHSTTVNLKDYVVKDAAGNTYRFSANHYHQPGDYVILH